MHQENPPGYYLTDEGEQRWWDGFAWTDQVKPVRDDRRWFEKPVWAAGIVAIVVAASGVWFLLRSDDQSVATADTTEVLSSTDDAAAVTAVEPAAGRTLGSADDDQALDEPDDEEAEAENFDAIDDEEAAAIAQVETEELLASTDGAQPAAAVPAEPLVPGGDAPGGDAESTTTTSTSTSTTAAPTTTTSTTTTTTTTTTVAETGASSPTDADQLDTVMAVWFDPAYDELNGDRDPATCLNLLDIWSAFDEFDGWKEAVGNADLLADLEGIELAYVEALASCDLEDPIGIEDGLAAYTTRVPRSGPPSSWT